MAERGVEQGGQNRRQQRQQQRGGRQRGGGRGGDRPVPGRPRAGPVNGPRGAAQQAAVVQALNAMADEVQGLRDAQEAIRQEQQAAEQEMLRQNRIHAVIDVDPLRSVEHKRGPGPIVACDAILADCARGMWRSGMYCSAGEQRVLLILIFLVGFLGTIVSSFAHSAFSVLPVMITLFSVGMLLHSIRRYGWLHNWFARGIFWGGQPFDPGLPNQVVSNALGGRWFHEDTWWSKWLLPHRRGYVFGHQYAHYPTDVRVITAQTIVTCLDPQLIQVTTFGYYTFDCSVVSKVLLDALLAKFRVMSGVTRTDLEVYARNQITFLNVHAAVHSVVVLNTINLVTWILKM